MKKKIDVSVIIVTYNQEKYIRCAIDSVINQKVNFNYEILLAEDCSPDNTLDVFKEYKEKYSDLIRIIPRDHNLGNSFNVLDAAKNSNGRYITVLEGDDYWCDSNKLQKQYDFLENHKDYVAVSHLQDCRDENNNKITYAPRREIKSRNETLDDFMKCRPFSLSCSLYVNVYKNVDYEEKIKRMFSITKVRIDEQMCIFLLTIGKVYIIAEPMMVYRLMHSKEEQSYNSKNSIDKIIYDSIMIDNELGKLFPNIDFRYHYDDYIGTTFLYLLYNKNLFGAFKYIKYIPKKYKLRTQLLLPHIIFKRAIRFLFESRFDKQCQNEKIKIAEHRN